jgi:hypothetical protein
MQTYTHLDLSKQNFRSLATVDEIEVTFLGQIWGKLGVESQGLKEIGLNAHEALDCELPNLVISKHNIVIVYELEPHDHRRETKRSFVLPRASFYAKSTTFYFSFLI